MRKISYFQVGLTETHTVIHPITKTDMIIYSAVEKLDII